MDGMEVQIQSECNSLIPNIQWEGTTSSPPGDRFPGPQGRRNSNRLLVVSSYCRGTRAPLDWRRRLEDRRTWTAPAFISRNEGVLQ